jgi:hypothetical protein
MDVLEGLRVRGHRVFWIGVAWLAIAVSPLYSQARAEDALQVAKVTSEPATSSGVFVSVDLLNRSQRLITGYSVSATVTWSTGEISTGELTVDVIWSLVNERLGEAASVSSGSLGPGQTKTSRIFLGFPAKNVSLTGATAAVQMVAFDDKTAIGDSGLISKLEWSRRRDAAEAADMLADLETVQRAPSIEAGMKAAIASANARNAERSTTGGGGHREFLQMLEKPLKEHPEAIGPYAAAWRTRQAILIEQCSLKRIDGLR